MKRQTLLCITLILTACTGGNVTVDLGATRVDPSGNIQWLNIKTFQNATEDQWLKDAAGAIYTKQNTVTFTGTCLRSVQKISVKIDGKIAIASTTCNSDGTFTWSQSGISEATHSFDFVGIDILNQELTPTQKETVVVDITAPRDPVVTTNSGRSPYRSPTQNLTLQGTLSADTVSVTISGTSTTASISGNQFSAPIQLTAGQTVNLLIKAVDLAGNVSSGTPFQINYQVDQVLFLSGFTVTSLGTPSQGNNAQLENASMDPQAGTANGKASNGTSIYQMLLGFVNHLYR